MNEADWEERRILEKYGSNLGRQEGADISEGFNLSQQLRAENTDPGNYTVYSTTQFVLSLHLPDAQEIKSNSSVVVFEEWQPFEVVDDFSGRSGMNIAESSSNGKVTYTFRDISGFLESRPGEMLILPGVKSKSCKSILGISGSASSQVQKRKGASECVSYQYEAGVH